MLAVAGKMERSQMGRTQKMLFVQSHEVRASAVHGWEHQIKTDLVQHRDKNRTKIHIRAARNAKFNTLDLTISLDLQTQLQLFLIEDVGLARELPAELQISLKSATEFR